MVQKLFQIILILFAICQIQSLRHLGDEKDEEFVPEELFDKKKAIIDKKQKISKNPLLLCIFLIIWDLDGI